MTPPPTIRLATPADLAAINAIYNHYVGISTCTYQTEPSTEAERLAWFSSRGVEHPVTVAELDGDVVGWGALSRFHPRQAYRQTVENAVYVNANLHHRGIGTLLLADLIDLAQSAEHHAIVALIDSEQLPSLALHAKHGFVEAGRLREVGNKFYRWLDVIYMQLLLPRPSNLGRGSG